MTHIIAIAGGKGGTGKTFIAVNITYIMGNENEKILLIDADVENPSVPSVINISFTKIIESKSFRPVINEKKCNKCGSIGEARNLIICQECGGDYEYTKNGRWRNNRWEIVS